MGATQLTELPYLTWRVCGIFTPDAAVLQDAVEHLALAAGLDDIVYLRARGASGRLTYRTFVLEALSSKRSMHILEAKQAITPRTLLILDNVETIRHYPQSMTRNIINYLAPRTRYKLIAGQALVVDHLHDLYAPFAVLDKRILHAPHYWAFSADHREVSVFDGHTVMGNKDIAYTAAKLKPFVYLDLEPANELQAELYAAIAAAPLLDRAHNVEDLRL